MRKICYRFIGIVLGFVMLFACIAALGGCNTLKDDPPALLSDYRIIYSSSSDYSKESSYAIDLQKQLKKIYGLELVIDTDSVTEGDSGVKRKEILIGHTNRTESQSAAERVTRLDYLVTRSGNKIILVAGSNELLGNCVTYFLENGIGPANGAVTVKNFEEHLELYNYPHEETSARIISLNLRYANSSGQNNQRIREPRICKMIEDAKPDSIGVQECESFWRKRLINTIGNLGYECAQDEAYSNTYDYAFKNFIWYNTATTKLVDSGKIWLSETPDIPSTGFGSKFYISAAWAILESKATGVQYVHFNVHLDSIDEDIREKELGVLLAKIKPYEEKGYNVFITGDFNSDMSAGVYRTMKESFLDARENAIESTNLYTFNGYKSENVIIDTKSYKCYDFCFYRESVNIVMKKFNVVDRYGGGYMSDHNALIIDFTLYER